MVRKHLLKSIDNNKSWCGKKGLKQEQMGAKPSGKGICKNCSTSRNSAKKKSRYG
jgi:hypothetical protein